MYHGIESPVRPALSCPAAARAKLDAAESRRENILLFHIANGVNIESRTVQIDDGVVIAPGATILAGTILRGKTVIGAGCVIGPNTLIEDSTVDEGTTVNASQVWSLLRSTEHPTGPLPQGKGPFCMLRSKLCSNISKPEKL